MPRLHEYPSTSTAAAVAVVWYRLFSTTFILRFRTLSIQILSLSAPHAAHSAVPPGQATGLWICIKCTRCLQAERCRRAC